MFTMETATKRLGVNNKITSFTVLLGTIMQGVQQYLLLKRFNDPLAATEDEAVRFHPNPQPQKS